MNKRQHEQLNIMCAGNFGMSYDDMPDLTFVSDLFAEGYTVSQVFQECLSDWADDDSAFAQVVQHLIK